MYHQWSSVAAPVPDEAALHVRMLPEETPIVRKPAIRIAHCMRVLAQEQRPVVIPHSVDQMGAVLGARVHGRDHLGDTWEIHGRYMSDTWARSPGSHSAALSGTQRHSAGFRRETRATRGALEERLGPSEGIGGRGRGDPRASEGDAEAIRGPSPRRRRCGSCPALRSERDASGRAR